MRTWSEEQIAALNHANSFVLRVSDVSSGESTTDVELGMVIAEDDLYVRAYRGQESGWYQAAIAGGHGQIEVGDEAIDVVFTATDPSDNGLHDEIDSAYRNKYGANAQLVTDATARAATLRIAPR